MNYQLQLILDNYRLFYHWTQSSSKQYTVAALLLADRSIASCSSLSLPSGQLQLGIGGGLIPLLLSLVYNLLVTGSSFRFLTSRIKVDLLMPVMAATSLYEFLSNSPIA